jgi:hypothetical protein
MDTESLDEKKKRKAHERLFEHRESWPELPLERWSDTYATLHMWTQIVGKIRLALSPRVNHWWEVPLYVSARGLTTSAIPYQRGVFEMEFDFIEHRLDIRTSEGTARTVELRPRTVADFYAAVMQAVASLGIEVKIWTMPVEVPNRVRFTDDVAHASYEGEFAHRFWRVLLAADSVMKEFRSRFIGKSSPVHFFWGSFDLAVTRFSGRRAPERANADAITREAYSHEVSSAGFWPGAGLKGAAFYSYAAPEPPGFPTRSVRPQAAFYHSDLKEFVLMYGDVRSAPSPRTALADFLQSTYEAAAEAGDWDREALEKAA